MIILRKQYKIFLLLSTIAFMSGARFEITENSNFCGSKITQQINCDLDQLNKEMHAHFVYTHSHKHSSPSSDGEEHEHTHVIHIELTQIFSLLPAIFPQAKPSAFFVLPKMAVLSLDKLGQQLPPSVFRPPISV